LYNRKLICQKLTAFKPARIKVETKRANPEFAMPGKSCIDPPYGLGSNIDVAIVNEGYDISRVIGAPREVLKTDLRACD